jgi:hypothetical protein
MSDCIGLKEEISFIDDKLRRREAQGRCMSSEAGHI